MTRPANENSKKSKSLPPDPLIEIGKLVKEGFDYARRCLRQATRQRKEPAKLKQIIADLQSRQEYLENLLIRRSD